MQILLFGRPAVRDGERIELWPAERRFQLLGYLAVIGDWVERERLGALFWPEHDAEAAHTNVRKAIHRARELQWLDGFETRGAHLRWMVDADVQQFDRAAHRDEHGQAYALYRGPLLDGMERAAPAPYLTWLRVERERRALARRRAALALIDASADARARLVLAEGLLADDPLDEEALAAAVVALRALGDAAAADRLLRGHAQRLATELGLEPSARLRALAAGARSAGGSAAPGEPSGSAEGFVGRRLELRVVGEKMRAPDGPRLLLLHGPGGVGKSRLARQVMAAVADSFADGVHWVALEDLAEPAQMAPRLAGLLGLQWRDGPDALKQFAARIGTRQALLVFDNAEHLPALGGEIAALLAACPRLRVIVTSRARLDGVDGEALTLDGLAVPDEDSRDAEAAQAFDAVRLFVERAVFHLPTLRPAAQIDAVIDIVRQVQGLPLAIEMAAAWVRLLPVPEIARELRRSIDLLARDADAAAAGRPEHASVRAAIERSWSLLAPAEREALAALSMFVGGFTREAAQAVAGATMPLLAALVDKSLVHADRERGRFDLHPLVAAYAGAQLAAAAQREIETRARHRAHFAHWLARVADETSRGTGEFRARVDPDLENCRAAWISAVDARDAGLLARMVLPLANYLSLCGRYEEGVQLLARARELADDDRPAQQVLAHVHRMIASMYWNGGRQEGVRVHARLGIRYARAVDDRPTVKSCLCTMGLSLEARNRSHQARRYYRCALQLAEADRDPYWIAVACTNLGGIALQLGEHAESLRHHLRALQIHREIDNLKGVVKELNNVGNYYRVVRDWVRAERHLSEGLALAERHEMNVDLAYLRVNLGLVEQERDNHDAAERCFERTIALRDRGANPWLVTEATYGLARVAARRGDAARARRHLRDGVRLALAIDHEHYVVEGAIVYAEVVAAAGNRALARALCLAVSADPRADATLRADATQVIDRLGTHAVSGDVASGPLPAIDAVIGEIARSADS